MTTAAQVEALVTSHTVRFFMTGGGLGGGRGGSGNIVSSWVQANCQLVDSSLYSAATSSTSLSQTDNRGGNFASGSLYKCGG
jgi:hypothetical protein